MHEEDRTVDCDWCLDPLRWGDRHGHAAEEDTMCVWHCPTCDHDIWISKA